jgi:predicted nuclease of predicted toxin-antitoxin system
MKFKTDENMPLEIVEILREADYDASSVSEQKLDGEPDPVIARICREEKRILLTLDTDFADIRTYPPEDFSGIIVFRLRRQDKFNAIKVFRRVMRLFSKESLENRLWIVEEDRIRIRE